MRKIALLDFDGTLSRGYICIDFLDFLFRKGICPPHLYQEQRKLIEKYQTGKISYENWCDRWGILWAKGLNGNKVSKVENLAKVFFKKFKTNIFPSSYQLIEILKEKGYHTLLVATAAFEVASLAAADLGIDEVQATRVTSHKGIYSDKLATNFHKPEGKKEFIEYLIKSGKYDLTNSVAFGDSPHDVAMLERVRFPIALNPSKEMLSLARKNKWAILNYNSVVKYVRNLLK